MPPKKIDEFSKKPSQKQGQSATPLKPISTEPLSQIQERPTASYGAGLQGDLVETLVGPFGQMSTGPEAQTTIYASTHQPRLSGAGGSAIGYGEDAPTRALMERAQQRVEEMWRVPFLEMAGGPGVQASGAQILPRVGPKECPNCREKEPGPEHRCDICPNCKCVVDKSKNLHYCDPCLVCNGVHGGTKRCYRPRPGATEAEKNEIEEQKRQDRNADQRERDKHTREQMNVSDTKRWATIEAEREKAEREKAEREKAEKEAGKEVLSKWAKTDEQKQADNKDAKKKMAAVQRNSERQTKEHELPRSSYDKLDFEVDTQQPVPLLTRPSRPPPSTLPSVTTEPAASEAPTTMYDPIRDTFLSTPKSQESRDETAGTTGRRPKAGPSLDPKAKEKRKSAKKPDDSTKKPRKK